jgi:hypothetical protein
VKAGSDFQAEQRPWWDNLLPLATRQFGFISGFAAVIDG